LVAHHVKPKSQYPELKFDLENGVTLCVDCHKDHHKKHPVKGIGRDVVGKVALKKRIKELEEVVESYQRQVEKLNQLPKIIYASDDMILALKSENSDLKDEIRKLNSMLLYFKKSQKAVPV
jgi:predicted RNase H-like nuclease (RuvC/YqgF family)